MNNSGAAPASSSPAPPRSGGRIDVHHHFLPDDYVESWGKEKLGSITAAGSVAPWSVDLSLELMALAGVETVITSISSPGWPAHDAETVAAVCRTANETAGRLRHDHPRHFGMFGNLPLPDVDRTLAEIAHCFDVLAVDGVAMFTNYGGKYLGDPSFDPVYAELARRNAVVFVHPITPPGGKSLHVVSESTLDYPFETTRAVVNALFYGLPARFPSLRFIFSHAGGTVPYLAGRVATFSALNSAFQQRGFEGVMPALAGFWYDITQSANAATFAALRAVVPTNKLLFGTDVPFARKAQIESNAVGLAQLDLTGPERTAIDRTNALALFPRLDRDDGEA